VKSYSIFSYPSTWKPFFVSTTEALRSDMVKRVWKGVNEIR
jgi:hypothetical protein